MYQSIGVQSNVSKILRSKAVQWTHFIWKRSVWGETGTVGPVLPLLKSFARMNDGPTFV